MGVCVTHALEERKLIRKNRWWRHALVVSLLLPVGAFSYHRWFDPAVHIVPTYSMTVNGSEASFMYLYGEAGGEPRILATGYLEQNGLIGGQTYQFECVTIGRDGAQWLRYHRFGQVWWAPRSELHVPSGTQAARIPNC